MNTKILGSIIATLALSASLSAGCLQTKVKDNHDGFYDIEVTNTCKSLKSYDIAYQDVAGRHVLKNQLLNPLAKAAITTKGSPTGITISER